MRGRKVPLESVFLQHYPCGVTQAAVLLGESHCGSFMQPSPSNCSLSMTYTPNHCHEPWVVILSLMIPVPFSYICKWSFIKISSNCSNKVATSSPLGLKIKNMFLKVNYLKNNNKIKINK